ncbi:MAG TPA: hypothetical protein ENK18_02960 [Deltaproteobacteria bacterium]|nr:hypothetical protein [Deltaproteobacteria bacterium]
MSAGGRLLWLWLGWGCHSPDQDPLERDEDVGLSDPSCEERYTGPLVVDRLSGSCDGDDQLKIVLKTRGWASRAVWTVVGTAAQQPWIESHVLESADFDPCGAWDELRLEGIVTGGGTWSPGEQTRFSCDQLLHTPPLLTRVIQLYALDGSLAECLASGHDPAGLLTGGYDALLSVPLGDPEEIERCLIVEPLPGRTPTW